MAKNLPDILGLPWNKQAAYLQGLSHKDLEFLWLELQVFREKFDPFYLAVFSILRDHYESEGNHNKSTDDVSFGMGIGIEPSSPTNARDWVFRRSGK